MRKVSYFCNKQGFTLIELVIVIGVLGVLAASLLVAIDPLEQLARARDAGKKSSVKQLGEAMQAYYSLNGNYFTPTTTWMETLIASGDLKSKVKNTDTSVCSYYLEDGNIYNFCYMTYDSSYSCASQTTPCSSNNCEAMV